MDTEASIMKERKIMQQHDYDKILYRLINIISRLSDGEILYKDALALEFNVLLKQSSEILMNDWYFVSPFIK